MIDNLILRAQFIMENEWVECLAQSISNVKYWFSGTL